METIHDELERLLVLTGHRKVVRGKTLEPLPSKDGKQATARKPEPPTIEPKLLDIKQAAQYLGSTIWYVRTLIWNSEIPAKKHGKKWFIAKSDLDKFIQESHK